MLLLLALTARGASPDADTLIVEVRASIADAHTRLDVLAPLAAKRSAEAVACVERHRSSIAALSAVADKAIPEHAEAVEAGHDEQATHALRKLAVIDSKVDQYREESARCLAEQRVGPPRPPPRLDPGPDPTDTPAYYALDEQGWVSAWSGMLAD